MSQDVVHAATPVQKIKAVAVYIDPGCRYIANAPLSLFSKRCPKILDYVVPEGNLDSPSSEQGRPDAEPHTELIKGIVLRFHEDQLALYGISYILKWLWESARTGYKSHVELQPEVANCIDVYQAFNFFGLYGECEEYGRYIDMSISNMYHQFRLPAEQVQAIWECRKLPGTARFTNRLVSLLVDHTRQYLVLQQRLEQERSPYDATHPMVQLMNEITAFLTTDEELNTCVMAAYKRIYRPPLSFCPVSRHFANAGFVEAPKGPTEELSPACWLKLCTGCAESGESSAVTTWSSRARAVWAVTAELKVVEAEIQEVQTQMKKANACYVRTPPTFQDTLLKIENLPD